MSDILHIVIFLLWVNGLPPLVAILIHGRFENPVDGGRLWSDGRPLFGRNKTVRGVVAATVGGILLAPFLGVPWWAGSLAGFLAMIGDLTSSFVKRRMQIDSGGSVFLLDQLFESLLPLLFFNLFLQLTLLKNFTTLFLFTLVAYTSSRLWLHITGRPLPARYPRVVQSMVRFHEWRSCHTPLARWQVWFNLTSFLSDQVLLTWLFHVTGLYSKGKKNALAIGVTERIFSFSELPEKFDGLRILFLTDLHLDGLEGVDHELCRIVQETDMDLCLIGGDLRMKTYGDSDPAISKLELVLQHVRAPLGSFGVLGNHDCIEMLPNLEDAGLIMLVNDGIAIERDNERIWIAGVDDPHYYRLHDVAQATSEIPDGDFTIVLAHSPEAYIEAEENGAHLYLCGHTHGGQVCLEQGVPIITNSRAPRYTASGPWRHGRMQGYTSRGVAPSSIPVRFNCPGEIVCITLQRTK
ncbi:CDP-archaeol synthase [Desulfopila aestuarii]|uniref:Calcineurin-like phosphoesterase domain-containing protein n=1 Tax=Desulfopila aestuarii DSM 18488 TaxID=1121416 RepID=A0A1M7Y383_9BACT|nr:CDP-archaeol synthase [Desulfopila aestuarii]SHO46480.1 hypothetical protein SAMN02745220_01524 [Desulfopila aestuarii DSM 18488]